MFGLGAGELLLIFIIALLFLGPKKLPELAKGLGQAMKEFQKAREDVVAEIQKPHSDTKKDTIEATTVESTVTSEAKDSSKQA